MTRLRFLFVRSAIAVLVAATAAPAAAQEFVIGAADAGYRLRLGSVVQVDGRAATGDAVAAPDRFVVRKARVVVDAQLTPLFDVRLVPDFASGALQLPDAYLETRFSTGFRLRAGRSKVPVGYELLVADADGWFPERALPSALVPNRDVGIEALGDVAGGRLSYAAGVFDGSADGASAAAGAAGSDLAGRVVVLLAHGLGVHVGASTGGATALSPLRTSVGETYFSYAAGAVATGRHDRVAPAVFIYRGPFGAYAEYARSTQSVERGAETARVSNTAYAVSASYALTGERLSDRNLDPRTPFDPSARRWGGLQVLARYGALAVDRDAFAAGLVTAGASRTARQATVALNWFPARFVKWYAAYERTSFDRGSAPARAPERAGIVRAQVAF